MIKAVFFDIDGTLLSYATHRIPESTLTALRALREKGIKLCIATGRPRSRTIFLDDYFPFDGYITMNGQYCTAGNQLIRKSTIAPADVAQLIHLSKHLPFSCTIMEENDMYINSISETLAAHFRMTKQDLPRVEPDFGSAIFRDVYQAVAYTNESGADIIRTTLSTVRTACVAPCSYDIMPADGGKDAGIAAILSHFHIDRAETMVFGDGENDLSMIQYAGIGVAMGNADPSLKAQANYVTAPVDENGILQALHHYNIL